MNNDQKRAYVANLYHGTKWKKKVAKMHMDMVTSIYLKHQRKGTMPKHNEEPTQGLLDISIEHPKSTHPHENEDEFPIV